MIQPPPQCMCVLLSRESCTSWPSFHDPWLQSWRSDLILLCYCQLVFLSQAAPKLGIKLYVRLFNWAAPQHMCVPSSRELYKLTLISWPLASKLRSDLILLTFATVSFCFAGRTEAWCKIIFAVFERMNTNADPKLRTRVRMNLINQQIKCSTPFLYTCG